MTLVSDVVKRLRRREHTVKVKRMHNAKNDHNVGVAGAEAHAGRAGTPNTTHEERDDVVRVSTARNERTLENVVRLFSR